MKDQTRAWQIMAAPRVALRKMKEKAEEENGTVCNGWADPGAFRRALSEKDTSVDSEQNTGGVPLVSDGSTAYVDSSDRHTLVIGSTGSMKSRLLCMPTLEMLARCGESVVVADPKGELYVRTAESFRSRGYNVQVINLRNPLCGCRWNPLDLPYRLSCGNSDDVDVAKELAMDLSMNIMPIMNEKDPFWDISSRGLFYGLITHLMHTAKSVEELTIAEICKLKNHIFADDYSRSEFEMECGSDPEYSGILSVINTAENTRRCILGNFDMFLWNYISNSSLVDMMSGNDIDLARVGREKTALFLIVPDEKNTYNGLVSLFIKQMYESLIREAQECDGGALPVRVNMVLDEFASFPKISSMQNMITASRSRNIRFMLVVQSVKQLRAIYGNDADAIKDNCLNWVFLSGRDMEFLNELCHLVGEDKDGKPLVTASRLQRMDREKGEALVLCGRMAPYITNLADIDRYPCSAPSRFPEPRNMSAGMKVWVQKSTR